MSVLEDTIFSPQVIILSVFGYTNKISEQDIQDNTLIPILHELGRIPDKILIPSEGNSSIYIQEWAESLHIKIQVFHSDWVRNGKIAQILRDDRMSKECTHALVFLSNKSNKLEKYSEKLCKRGKHVFTSSHNQELTELIPVVSPKVSMPVRKSNTETGQTLLKFQKKV